MKRIGSRVKRLREALGMSRTDLASHVGLSSQAIAALENGVSKQPSFVVGIQLARVLRVRPYELAGLIPPPSVHFGTDDGKLRFDLVLHHPDAGAAEIVEWTRQLVDAIGAIPGVQIESATAVDSTAASLIARQASDPIGPVIGEPVARIIKAIEALDRRLRAIEGSVCAKVSAKKSNAQGASSRKRS